MEKDVWKLLEEAINETANEELKEALANIVDTFQRRVGFQRRNPLSREGVLERGGLYTHKRSRLL